MNIKIQILIVALVAMLAGSCDSNQNSAKNIAALYSKRGIVFDKETKFCIVLPEVGCGGCIAGGVRFIANNREKFSKYQNEYLVVFTSINSKKLLFRNMGFDIERELNCIIDSLDCYKVKTSMKFYPMLIKLKCGQISEVYFQYPHAHKDIFEEVSKEW